MKKMRWIMILALVIAVGLIAGAPAAKADANLMENGSVQYVYIPDEDGLRQYIDADGLYASQEDIQSREVGNTYKVIIEESGDLVICPLSDHISYGQIKAEFALYSDFKLTSQLVSGQYTSSDRSGFLRVHVEPGAYYYRSVGGAPSSRRNDGKNTLTVYIGFIPDNPSSGKSVLYHEDKAETPEATVVSYAYINDKADLYNYINHNGKYSVQVHLGLHQASDPYSVVVEEPGELVICPMVMADPNSGMIKTIVSVYSNRELTSKILDSVIAQRGNRFNYYSVSVEPGVYYIQGVGGAGPSQGDNPLTIYLGLIPADGRQVEQAYPTEDAADAFVKVIELTDENALADIAEKHLDPASSHTLRMGDVSDACAFRLDEPGKLVLAAVTTGRSGSGFYNTIISVFSDADLTSLIMRFSASDESKVQCSAKLVDAGTYYYQLIGGACRDRVEEENTEVYIGIIPSSDVFSVDHTEATATETKVSFSIAEAYNPDKYLALVRVVPGRVLPFDADNQDIWHEENMDNAIESHDFIATENGIYTARIAGPGLQTYLLTFEVTGIGGNAPEQELPAEPEATPLPEAAPDTEITEAPAETEIPAEPPAPMTSAEMRKYIRAMEDQIEDLGLELPEFSSELTQEQYMQLLEQVLHDNGYDL